MKNRKTPKPESTAYDIENPQNLNNPDFNSSTDRRGSAELPAVENMNNEKDRLGTAKSDDKISPKTNLGNGQRDKKEEDREKIIRR